MNRILTFRVVINGAQQTQFMCVAQPPNSVDSAFQRRMCAANQEAINVRRLVEGGQATVIGQADAPSNVNVVVLEAVGRFDFQQNIGKHASAWWLGEY